MRSEPTGQPSGAIGNQAPAAPDKRAQQVSYEVVNSYPHDPTSFTQGFLWANGGFYESTGQYGQSKLRRLEFPSGKVIKQVSLDHFPWLEFPSGKVIKQVSLDPELFGEGLALAGPRLLQLTWKSHRGF